jgi:ribosomal protein L22
MAEEKKDTKAKSAAKGGSEKPAAEKPAARKPAAKATGARKTAKTTGERKPAARKAAAKKDEPAKSAAAKTEPAGAKKPAAKTPAAAKKPASPAKPKPKPKPREEPVAAPVRARASYVRVAPRKARLIADQVRGLPLEDARTLLRFSPRGAARDIAKLIDSAAANAENNHDLVADDLMVSDIRVDEGPTLRRYRARALGRATRINKRTSHIQVALTPED